MDPFVKNDDLHQVLGCLLGSNPPWYIGPTLDGFTMVLYMVCHWIPSIYPSHVNIWIPAKWILWGWMVNVPCKCCNPLLMIFMFTMDFPPFISGPDHSGYGISHWPIATSSGSPKHISSCAFHHSSSKGDRTASTMGTIHMANQPLTDG